MHKTTTILTFAISLLVSSLAYAGSVSRGQFTNDIIDREPVDQVISLQTDSNRIKYFTELNDLQGQTVTHRWEYNGSVMFEMSFDVGGPRWRVWSSKTLQPGWTGEWVVHTVDSEGNTLLSQSFLYQ